MKFLSVVSFLFLSTTLFASDIENQVRVAEVKGSAQIRLAVDQEWSDLKVGDLIPEGCWIQTAFRSKVYLKFWNNTVVQVKSASLVQIKGLSHKGSSMGGRLHLSLGSAQVRVKPDRKEMVDFKVVTPGMTTSIKGTVVYAAYRGFNNYFHAVVSGLVSTQSHKNGKKILHGMKQDGVTNKSIEKPEPNKPSAGKKTLSKEVTVLEAKKTLHSKNEEVNKAVVTYSKKELKVHIQDLSLITNPKEAKKKKAEAAKPKPKK